MGIKSLVLKNGSYRFQENLKGPQFKLGIGMTHIQIQINKSLNPSITPSAQMCPWLCMQDLLFNII